MTLQGGTMGLSIAKPELYFIYVLRLEHERWYVGSTKNIARRMRSHFARGGALATTECCPVDIEVIYRLMDYQIRTDCAHERAEVIVAAGLADKYGKDKVRGAKHGKGWEDMPTSGNLRDIDRYQRFANTQDGAKLLSSLELLPVDVALDEQTRRLLQMYRSRRMLGKVCKTGPVARFNSVFELEAR